MPDVWWSASRSAAVPPLLIGLLVTVVLFGSTRLMIPPESRPVTVRPAATARAAMATDSTSAAVPWASGTDPLDGMIDDPWLHIRSAPLPTVTGTLPPRPSPPIAALVTPAPPPVMTPTDR